jgi:nitroimidazol reductase NimA-like FMN-containing flavoprotein (pyridoxamine 5'-phosphate oxidase superfamily)
MATIHSREEILALLGRKKLATLATAGPGSLRTRCMFFAHDEALNIYMMATVGSAKISEMRTNPDVSVLATEEDEVLFNTVEVEVQGRAEVLTDDAAKMSALKLLAPKCPFAQFALEAQSGESFDVVKIKPRVLIYRVYGEASTGVGATVLTF